MKSKNLIKRAWKRDQPVLKNSDRVCIVCQSPYKAVSHFQKTCSLPCRKIHYAGHQARFKEKNPGAMKKYNANRVKKHKAVWKDKWNSEREMIISKLGGKCVVRGCNIKNPLHLHIDYIPTMIGTGYRHPRHKAWVLANIKDFRLLCANHHYELTLSGKIKGTKITQKKK